MTMTTTTTMTGHYNDYTAYDHDHGHYNDYTAYDHATLTLILTGTMTIRLGLSDWDYMTGSI